MQPLEHEPELRLDPGELVDLVAQAKGPDAAGRERARERLCLALYHPIKRFVRARLRGGPEVDEFAQDVAQATLALIDRHVAGCHASSDRQVMAWTLTIARHVALDFLRRAGAALGVRLASPHGAAGLQAAALEQWHAAATEPVSAPEERWLLRCVFEAYGRLPPQTSTIFFLYLIRHDSWRELGAELGLSAGAARLRFQRAQAALRRAVRRRVAALDPAMRRAVEAALARYARGREDA